MSTTYIQEGPDRLVLQERGGLLVRLFGLPFLAAALYFTYHWLMAIIESIRGRVEFLSALPGILFLPVMMFLFGFPGIMLAFGRKRVWFDSSGVITEQRDYVLFRRNKHYSAKDFVRVQAAHAIRQAKSKSKTTYSQTYPVQLIRKEGGALLLVQADDSDTARDLGMRVSSILGLPLQDVTKVSNSATREQN